MDMNILKALLSTLRMAREQRRRTERLMMGAASVPGHISRQLCKYLGLTR
jgi:hypothetical protein